MRFLPPPRMRTVMPQRRSCVGLPSLRETNLNREERRRGRMTNALLRATWRIRRCCQSHAPPRHQSRALSTESSSPPKSQPRIGSFCEKKSRLKKVSDITLNTTSTFFLQINSTLISLLSILTPLETQCLYTFKSEK